jgi:cytoskeletal protein RodZ
MKNNKENLFVILLCLTLILPLAFIGAQESDNFWTDAATADKNYSDNTETAAPETAAPNAAIETTTTETTTPKTAAKNSGQAPSLKAPTLQGTKTVTAFINSVIGNVAKIGNIFGKTTGIRIGGTSGSAIAMLVIAKLIQDRGPDWVKWLLYLSGGTMIAGSGANITKLIMGFLS